MSPIIIGIIVSIIIIIIAIFAIWRVGGRKKMQQQQPPPTPTPTEPQPRPQPLPVPAPTLQPKPKPQPQPTIAEHNSKYALIPVGASGLKGQLYKVDGVYVEGGVLSAAAGASSFETCSQACLDHPSCASFVVSSRNCTLSSNNKATGRLMPGGSSQTYYQFHKSREESLAALAQEEEEQRQLDEESQTDIEAIRKHNSQFQIKYDPAAGTKNIHRFGRIDGVTLMSIVTLGMHENTSPEVCADKCIADPQCKSFSTGDNICLLTPHNREDSPLWLNEDMGDAAYYEKM